VGDRVQRSVFEAYLDRRTRDRLLDRLKKRIDPNVDSVRLYTLCSTCRDQVLVLGKGEVTTDEPVFLL